MSFTIESFVSEIRTAAASEHPVAEVNAAMARAVADPAAVAAAVPRYDGDELALHEESDVSIYCVRFFPDVIVPPHNHKVPAFIGVYAGTEVNELYRHDGQQLELVKERHVGPGETLSIGAEGIHGVRTADPAEDSYALHVYLGHLKEIERELFRPDTGEAIPFTQESFDALLRKR